MLFKDDWDKCKQRFDAFWEGEIIDRCCISVIAPRKNPIDLNIDYKEAESLEQKWYDSEYRYNLALHWFSHTFYGGEAFPNFQINLGPGVVAAFMGSEFTLKNDTVWFSPNPDLNSWDKILKAEINHNSDLWKTAEALTKYFCTKSNGNYTVCNTDLGGTLDIAASLRGTETLLTDLFDFSEEVKALRDIIDDAWIKSYDNFQGIINKYQDGSTDWFPTYCGNKRSYALQCDFSAMISPSQFEDFVVPSLEKQAKALDRSIYHLDGPGEIPHLDRLLEIKEIDGIQWCPGDGQPGGCDEKWFPLYKKIQAKGKKLIILYTDNNKIENLLNNISPKGVFIQTYCSSEDEAEELIKKVKKWGGK